MKNKNIKLTKKKNKQIIKKKDQYKLTAKKILNKISIKKMYGGSISSFDPQVGIVSQFVETVKSTGYRTILFSDKNTNKSLNIIKQQLYIKKENLEGSVKLLFDILKIVDISITDFSKEETINGSVNDLNKLKQNETFKLFWKIILISQCIYSLYNLKKKIEEDLKTMQIENETQAYSSNVESEYNLFDDDTTKPKIDKLIDDIMELNTTYKTSEDKDDHEDKKKKILEDLLKEIKKSYSLKHSGGALSKSTECNQTDYNNREHIRIIENLKSLTDIIEKISITKNSYEVKCITANIKNLSTKLDREKSEIDSIKTLISDIQKLSNKITCVQVPPPATPLTTTTTTKTTTSEEQSTNNITEVLQKLKHINVVLNNLKLNHEMSIKFEIEESIKNLSIKQKSISTNVENKSSLEKLKEIKVITDKIKYLHDELENNNSIKLSRSITNIKFFIENLQKLQKLQNYYSVLSNKQVSATSSAHSLSNSSNSNAAVAVAVNTFSIDALRKSFTSLNDIIKTFKRYRANENSKKIAEASNTITYASYTVISNIVLSNLAMKQNPTEYKKKILEIFLKPKEKEEEVKTKTQSNNSFNFFGRKKTEPLIINPEEVKKENKFLEELVYLTKNKFIFNLFFSKLEKLNIDYKKE